MDDGDRRTVVQTQLRKRSRTQAVPEGQGDGGGEGGRRVRQARMEGLLLDGGRLGGGRDEGATGERPRTYVDRQTLWDDGGERRQVQEQRELWGFLLASKNSQSECLKDA